MRYSLNRHLHLKLHPFRKRRCFYIPLTHIVRAQNNGTEERNAYQADVCKFPSRQSIFQKRLIHQGNCNLSSCPRLGAGTEKRSSLDFILHIPQDNVEAASKFMEPSSHQQSTLSSDRSQLRADARIRSYSELVEPSTSMQCLNEVDELCELRKVYNLLRTEQRYLAKEIERRSNGLTKAICRHKKTLEQIELLEYLMQLLDEESLKPAERYLKSRLMMEPCVEKQIDMKTSTEVSTSIDEAENKRFPGGFNRSSEFFLQVTATYAAVRKYATRWLVNAGIRKQKDMALLDITKPTYNTTVTPPKLVERSRSTINLLEDEHPSLVSSAASTKTYIGGGQLETKTESKEEKEGKHVKKEVEKVTKKSNKRKNRKSAQSAESEGNGKRKRKGRKGSKRKSIDNERDRDTKQASKRTESNNADEVLEVEGKTGSQEEVKLDTKASLRSIRSTRSTRSGGSLGSRRKRDTGGPSERLHKKPKVKSDISLLEEYWGVSLRRSIVESPLRHLSTMSSVLDNLIEAETQKPPQNSIHSKSISLKSFRKSSKKSIKPKKPDEVSDLEKLLLLLKECEECEKQQKDAQYLEQKHAEQNQLKHCEVMRKAAGLPDCLPDEYSYSNEYEC